MKAPGAPLGGLVEARFLEHFLVIKIFELILQKRAIDPLNRQSKVKSQNSICK